ncbi:hypothetical protein CASFOL_012971 [Castilleja foliolosa]|uniref:F-box/LRR-repeat protein 15/At3g58940/PEG3-like LRR domain-containing protein n=1 Tax=Castilleja foliolosa TaxID=1961234 RepID=A0ABD3DIM3_9LAMI
MSCLSTALQRYHHQNLSVQNFFLEMSYFESKSTHLRLENLIKTLLQNNGVKTFRLHILGQEQSPTAPYFHLPPIVFNSESLLELHLKGCLIGSISNILFKNLHTLSLTRVDICQVTLGNMISSCPLLVNFFLEMSSRAFDSESTRLFLENLINTFFQNNDVKTFGLHIRGQGQNPFHLPPIVFNSESLRQLHLKGCMIGSISNISLENLYTLSLTRVDISQVTLENILSSCHLLVSLSLLGCSGLKTIDMSNNNNKFHGLKHFAVRGLQMYGHRQENPISVKIDISTIETITIGACQFHHHNIYFPNLKSLTLEKVQLSNNSFEIFSPTYMPRLECLTLDSCYGFEEIKMVLSDSVKHMTITKPQHHKFMNAVIEAPNIVTFAYEGSYGIHSGPVSFITNSIGWESKIYLSFYYDFNKDPSAWFANMNEQLGGFSGSRISLELSRLGGFGEVHVSLSRKQRHVADPYLVDQYLDDQYQAPFYERVPAIVFCGRDYEPVEVEQLSLRGRYTHTSLAAFLYCVFRICRPRYVGHDLFSNAFTRDEKGAHKEMTLLLYVILVLEKEIREQFWPRALEDVKMERFDDGVKFRFRLKWKDHQLS